SATSMQALVSSAYMAAADLPRIATAHRRLLAARIALHLAGGDDVLRLDRHEDFAAAMRPRKVDGGGATPVELGVLHEQLRDVMLAMRTIDHAHRRAWALIGADIDHGRRRRARTPSAVTAEGFEIVDGVLRIPLSDTGGDAAAAQLSEEGFALRLLTALVTHRVVLDRRSAATIRSWANSHSARWNWHVDDRRAALDALWSGSGVAAALAELDDVEILTSLMPEWAPLRGRAQRNPYHRYALDRHAWHAVEQLGRLVAEQPWAAVTLQRVTDREGLLLATLLHDVGKPVGEPHDKTGVQPARILAVRMGASRATVEFVARLTRWHLLLADTARRRDIADPVVVSDVAQTVGDRELLAALHLLAEADGRATGPSAWNPWIAGMVGQLVARVDAVLEGGAAAAMSCGPAMTSAEVERRADEERLDTQDVRRHVAQMPDRYVEAVGVDDIMRHAAMVAIVKQDRGSAIVRPATSKAASTDGDGRQSHISNHAWALPHPDRLDVVGFDRPQLFATLVDTISRQKGDIVAADLFSTDDGVTVATVYACAPLDADPEWWTRLSNLVECGEVSPCRRGPTRHGPGDSPSGDPQVEVWRRDDSQIVEVVVTAPDRQGLLARLVQTLEESAGELLTVRATSDGQTAVDTFTLVLPRHGRSSRDDLDAATLDAADVPVMSDQAHHDTQAKPPPGHDEVAALRRALVTAASSSDLIG
ncbi:MAG: hypothetical protein WD007_05900, partial [Nitriliruptoraceae bacterium]